MKIQIQSIHFDADQSLKDFIQKRCDKLDTFFDRIEDGQVYLKLEKPGEPSLKNVEVKINVPGETISGSGEAYKFEEAVDSAVDGVKRQLKKYKEIKRSYH